MTANLQRAYLYDSLAALFARECSIQTFSLLAQNAPGVPFLQALDCLAPAAAQRFRQTLAAMKKLPAQEAVLELRADFTHAFLLNPGDCAAPYAGAWLSADKKAQNWRNEHERKVRQWLQQHQLSIASDFREPADHLAILLAAAAMRARDQAPRAQQQDFLAAMLLSWLPQFCQRCQTLHLQFDFYPALASLLLSFVEADQQFLASDENAAEQNANAAPTSDHQRPL